jgi:hypothetical protein
MSLVRTYILVFIAGWVLWLWLEKTGPVQQAPASPPPYGGMPAPGYPGFPAGGGPPPPAPPPQEGDLIQEFQYGVDQIKRGEYQQSFIFLWRRQHWILAGVMTALFVLLLPGIGRRVSRWRRQTGNRPDGQ